MGVILNIRSIPVDVMILPVYGLNLSEIHNQAYKKAPAVR